MGQESDYYSVLRVSPQASAEELHQAYRQLVRQYHPDTHPHDQDAERHFRAITEAYETLSDPERRHQYDARLAAAQAVFAPQEEPPMPQAPDWTKGDVETALGEVASVMQAAVNEAADELRSYLVDLGETLSDVTQPNRQVRRSWDRRRFPPPPPPPRKRNR